jgi:hypothetical protein
LRLRKKSELTLGLYRSLNGLLKFWFLVFVSTVIGWSFHDISDWLLALIISIGIGIAVLYFMLRKKLGIIELNDLSEERKQHENRVMRQHALPAHSWVVDRLLRNHRDYGKLQNDLAIAKTKWNIGKGKKEMTFEKLWPLICVGLAVMFVGASGGWQAMLGVFETIGIVLGSIGSIIAVVFVLNHYRVGQPKR